jgi:prepilin peptidase CpaA
MSFPPLILQVILILIVGVAAVSDIRYRRIPNWLILAGLILGIGVNVFLFEWAGLSESLKGLGIAFLAYFPLYLLRGMGAGDVKLMAVVGCVVGWKNWLGILFLTAILGGLAALALLLGRRQLVHGLTNVGNLVAGLLSFRAPYARNEELDLASPKSMKLPHGVVIACACVLFLGAAWLWAPR